MKFIGKAQRAQLHRILDVVIDKNNQGDATFIRLQGHTGKIEVDHYSGEWSREKDESNAYTVVESYVDNVTSLEVIAEALEESAGEE